jgi:hypothetical protein
MTRTFKIRFLLTFLGVALGLLYWSTPEYKGFKDSYGYAEQVQSIHQIEMDLKGLVANQSLDLVAVQDTFQFWWEAMSPVGGWHDMEMSLMYVNPDERQSGEHNLRMWAKGQFANLHAGSDWMARWQQLPNISFEVAVETGDVTMGYLSGSLPVPGQPGKYLSFEDLEVQLHHS